MADLRAQAPVTQELLILRHAKSDWGRGIESDYDRPLSARGRRDAPQVGTWLKAQDLRPDVLLSSPALRARETAQAVYAALGLTPEDLTIRYEAGIYEAGRDTLLSVLGKVRPGTRRVLLIGHNPGLDSLLIHLCGQTLPYTGDGKLLTTAALARVGLSGGWQRLAKGSGRLMTLVRPESPE